MSRAEQSERVGLQPAEAIDVSPADVQGSRLAIGSTNAFARTGIKQSGGMNVYSAEQSERVGLSLQRQ